MPHSPCGPHTQAAPNLGIAHVGTSTRLCWTFFHPDYTVGPGFPPDPTLRLAGLAFAFTADREFHPALKVYLFIQFVPSVYANLRLLVKP